MVAYFARLALDFRPSGNHASQRPSRIITVSPVETVVTPERMKATQTKMVSEKTAGQRFKLNMATASVMTLTMMMIGAIDGSEALDTSDQASDDASN